MAMTETKGQEKETEVLATTVNLKEYLDIEINSMEKELDYIRNILSWQITVDTSLVTDF